MELYLIRHGRAEARTSKMADHDRALTDKGRAETRMVLRGLRRKQVRFGNIWCSPMLRSQQTAEILKPLFDGHVRSIALLASAPTQELISYIGRFSRKVDRPVALVGHQPWLGQLVGMLLVGDATVGKKLKIRKAGIVHLSGQLQQSGMVLSGLWCPQDFKQL